MLNLIVICFRFVNLADKFPGLILAISFHFVYAYLWLRVASIGSCFYDHNHHRYYCPSHCLCIPTNLDLQLLWPFSYSGKNPNYFARRGLLSLHSHHRTCTVVSTNYGFLQCTPAIFASFLSNYQFVQFASFGGQSILTFPIFCLA